MTWQVALQKTYQVAQHLLDHEEHRWAIAGSVASVLNGCQFEPGDLDILACRPEGVYQFAEAMMIFAPEDCPHPEQDEAWFSSKDLPVSVYEEYGFQWYFCRWVVADFEVEVAHIIPPVGTPISKDGAGIWEGGAEVWPHIRTVPFQGNQVPVVPLEIQLESNMNRGLKDRIAEIVHIFRTQRYNRPLLEQSLSRDHLQEFDQEMV
ncbi:MAG: hypothetical protein AAF629_09460 [Chloroflexota bacterium]